MAPHSNGIPKWNIIFLIYAELVDTTSPPTSPPSDDDVLAEIIKLDRDILDVELSDNFNLFTIKNSVEIKDNHIINDTTLITQLVFDEIQKKNIQKQLLIPRVQNFAQDGKSIRNVFQFIDETFPADKNLLITWDHGSVFGIFKKVLPDEVLQAQKDLIFNRKYETIEKARIITNSRTGEDEVFCLVKNRRFYSKTNIKNQVQPVESMPLTTNETIVDILTNDELANAITYGFKNKYVDVLIMFNCDMQNMQVCYSLRDCVKYFVAPESIISAPGYDYASIINLIGKNKNLEVDGAMVAIAAINTMKQYFINAGKDAKFEEHAMFAVCLEGYETKIIRFVKLLVDTLMQLSTSDDMKYLISNERSKCFTFGIDFDYDSVDFLNFVSDLSSYIKDLSHLNDYIQNAYNSIIIAQAVGKAVYPKNTGSSWEQMTHTPPKGVTLYFPTTAPDTSNAVVRDFISFGSRFSTSLMPAINWVNFLNKLYKD